MNRILWSLLLILLVVGAYVYFYKLDNTASLPDRAFGVEESEDIGKIFIGHRDGDQFTLERQGNQWLVNGQYPVFPNAMVNLLDAVTRMEIEYIPTRSAVPSIVRDLATLGIKVEIFDRSGEKIRNFYIGGTDPTGRSTYMIVEGQEQPYAMYIPSWEGNLRDRFLLKTKDWRDRTVITSSPEKIAKVEIEYPRTSSAGFVLEKEEGGQYNVSRTQGLDQREERELVTAAVQHFLTGFEKIGAESIDSDNPKRAEITRLIPYCTVQITYANGQTDSLALWPYNQAEEMIDFSPEFISQGPFRFFGEKNREDLYLLQRPMLEKIIVSYDYFFRIPRD